MSKYEPLAEYLRSRPPGERQVVLSMADVERAIGCALPKTARTIRPWWANTRQRTWATSWLDAGWKVDKVDLARERVSYVRLDGAPQVVTRLSRRYGRLQDFFKSIPSQQEQVALTLAEIGGLVGQPLPGTACRDRTWWANTRSSRQGSAWMSAGWRVESVFLEGEVVTFRRNGSTPLRTIPRYVQALVNGLPHVGRSSAEVMASWIKLCRRIGWFFEATVLYERGGMNVDALSVTDRAEVDEDYTVCKREISRCRGTLIAMTKG